jgi:hypothetical protein
VSEKQGRVWRVCEDPCWNTREEVGEVGRNRVQLGYALMVTLSNRAAALSLSLSLSLLSLLMSLLSFVSLLSFLSLSFLSFRSLSVSLSSIGLTRRRGGY